ncbi:MAG: hypothetical protein ACJAR2_001290 [Ilumatobacter sp.]
MFAALASAAVTLFLGLIRIGRSFGYDEGFTYFFFISGGSPRKALTTQIIFNNHPMFSAIQSVGWKLGFVGETTQRLGPALCGAAAVGITVWFVARYFGVIAGVGAGVILGLNPVFLEQFRQLRGYALATVAVLAAGAALWRSWSDLRHRWLVIQGACMVVAVTTHAYSAVTILMLAVATLALGKVRRAHLIAWASSAVVALLIMSPVLDDMRTNAGLRGNRYSPDFPKNLVRGLTGWETYPVIIVSAAVVAGLVVIARRSTTHLYAVIASSGVLVIAVLAMWQIVQPFDLYLRFFMSVIPLVAALAAIGIAQLPRPAQLVAVVAIAVLLAPGARDIIDAQPTMRDGAALINTARDAGYEVCGRNAEPFLVYSAPMRLITGIDDFEGCQVYASVLSMNSVQRESATATFGDSIKLGGGVEIWASTEVLAEMSG